MNKVIVYKFNDGTVKAVGYASRYLKNTEKCDSQIIKEAHAIISAAKKFHRKILGIKSIIAKW